MNLSTILMLFAAWQLLAGNKKGNTKQPLDGVADILSDDTKNILNCVDKLTSKNASQEDRTGALLQIISNPNIMDIASKIFSTKDAAKKESSDFDAPKNDEGYTFETPSSASKEFFQPIDNIADAEIKHKLYWFYDNWYIK